MPPIRRRDTARQSVNPCVASHNTRIDHESVFRPHNKKNDGLEESEEMKTNALFFVASVDVVSVTGGGGNGKGHEFEYV